MKTLIFSLFSLIIATASITFAEDIDIFECTTAVKPNVLFLLDTSSSMRKQDVYDHSIKDYVHGITDWGSGEYKLDSDGEPIPIPETTSDPDYNRFPLINDQGEILKDVDGNILYEKYRRKDWAHPDKNPKFSYTSDFYKLKYKNTKDLPWHKLLDAFWVNNIVWYIDYNWVTIDEAGCQSSKDALTQFGWYGPGSVGFDTDGPIMGNDAPVPSDDPVCEPNPSLIREKRTVVTLNYLNYEEYVEHKMAEMTYAEGVPGPLDDITDLEHYNPNRDYYNFYDTNVGYGDYPEKDRVYVELGMTREFIVWLRKRDGKVKFDGIMVDEIACDAVKNKLKVNGWCYERIWELGNGGCSDSAPRYHLKTGNFLNYLDMKRSRRYNGINAIWEVLQQKYDKARFGLMQFDLDNVFHLGNATLWKNDGADLSVPCGASHAHLLKFKDNLFRHLDVSEDLTTEYGQPLTFGNWKSDAKGTPLAESLIEAGLYFQGQDSWFNDYTIPDNLYGATDDWDDSHVATNSTNCYKSPIQCPDGQTNHIILITDGSPSYDFYDGAYDVRIQDTPFPYYAGTNGTTLKSKTIGNCDNDGNDIKTNTTLGLIRPEFFEMDWADDVAEFLNKNDMSALEGEQKIKIHVIGFRTDIDARRTNKAVLEDIAFNGGTNKSVPAKNKDDIVVAINAILEGELDPATFTSAVTPVRQDDMVYAGDNTFLSSFHITAGSRGNGNIKKYENSTGKPQAYYVESADGLPKIPLVKGNNVDINARDMFWTPGNKSKSTDIPYEGIAYVLKQNIEAAGENLGNAPTTDEILTALSDDIKGRKIYTSYLDGDDWVTDEINTLAEYNTGKITINNVFGTEMTDTVLKGFMAHYVYGYGLDWPLGDIVHSNLTPFTKMDSLGNEINLLYVGANDGMLHCFDQATGREKWAFIPPDLLTDSLYKLGSGSHSWSVDGAIEILTDRYSIGGGNYLIFGERRGGNAFHILDIAGEYPVYKGKVNSADRGQSWGIPDLCIYLETSGNQNSSQYGAVVGGGYDDRYDDRRFNPDTQTVSPAVKGSFISVFNVKTGDYVVEKLGDGIINHSVVDVRVSDLNHIRYWPGNDKTKKSYRLFENIFAGDLGGYVYNFYLDNDDDAYSASSSWNGTSHAAFKCPDITIDIPDPSAPSGTAEVVVRPKIFHAPVMGGPEVNNMLFFGTGDRENPRLIEENFFYGVNGLLGRAPSGGPLTHENLKQYNISDKIAPGCDECNHPIELVEAETEEEAEKQTRGWMLDLPFTGEKVISKPITFGNVVVFGTNSPNTNPPSTSTGSCEKTGCQPGVGRIYLVGGITDTSIEYVISKKTGTSDPMPQPELLFDADSNKVLVTSGDGTTFDIDISVISGEFWRHNTDQ